MLPPDIPDAGEPLAGPTAEKEPGRPIADCLRAIEDELEANAVSGLPRPVPAD